MKWLLEIRTELPARMFAPYTWLSFALTPASVTAPVLLTFKPYPMGSLQPEVFPLKELFETETFAPADLPRNYCRPR